MQEFAAATIDGEVIGPVRPAAHIAQRDAQLAAFRDRTQAFYVAVRHPGRDWYVQSWTAVRL